MKKWIGIFLAFTLLSTFSLGCTGSSKEQLIKCPKCGTYFKSQEGAEWFKDMGHRENP